MKIAVSIPDDLFRNAERLTKRLGLSRSALYQRALTEFLKRQDDQSVTDAFNKVYGDECDFGKLDPFLEHLQFASIPREDW